MRITSNAVNELIPIVPLFFYVIEIAELFFVDTTPLVDMYFADTEEHTYDWRAIPSRKAYTTNLLRVNSISTHTFCFRRIYKEKNKANTPFVQLNYKCQSIIYPGIRTSNRH